MSNFGQMPGQAQGRIPTPPRGEPIARYDTYLEAQRAVDYLSDNHFPVQAVTIVGTGLQMVERVTGRLTYPRVALAGAASGAWFGLLIGLLLSLFGSTDAALIAAPLFGAAFGMLFGVISYAFTGGRRDFTSTSQIVASEYAVLCLAEQAGAASQLLQQLPGGSGRGSWPDPAARSAPPSGPAAGSPPWGAPTDRPGTGQQPPVGTPYGAYGQGPAAPPPAAPGSDGPAPAPAPSAPDEPGLTYGEAIERQRQQRLERERAEREQAQERERALREGGADRPGV